MEFLEQNFKGLEASCNRRSNNFFCRMAESLGGTRDNRQCRSHHQKMLRRFHSVADIIDHFKEKCEEKSGEKVS